MNDEDNETAYPATPKDVVEALQNGWTVDSGSVVHRAGKHSLPFNDYVIGMHKFFNYGHQTAQAEIHVPGRIAEMLLNHFECGAQSVRYPIRVALGL
ncbi:MAG: hypothetical protein ACYCSN_20035 [Acidobacteriaceae bacterium]